MSIFKRKNRVPEVATESADHKHYEAENPDARLGDVLGGSPFAPASDATIESVEERVEHRLGVEDNAPTD